MIIRDGDIASKMFELEILRKKIGVDIQQIESELAKRHNWEQETRWQMMPLQ